MFFLAFFKKILYIANIVIIEIFEMRVCVKYNDNFWFNKLMRFIVFIYTNRSLTNCISSHTHTHTHTRTQKYYITTIFYLFRFGSFVKTISNNRPRVKGFCSFSTLSEGINKAIYGRNMPKETKNRSR